MNKETFYQYLRFPELLDDRSIQELEKVVEDYPYFQTAHLLFLKNLNNQGNIKYEKALKKSAVWINNREKLFYLLDKRVLLPVNEPFKIDKEKPTKSVTQEIFDFSELTDNTEFETTKLKSEDELTQLIMSGAAQSSPFFNVDDNVDLDDFKFTFGKSKTQENEEDENSGKLKSKRNKLIDKFIVDQPKISPSEKLVDAPIKSDNQTESTSSEMITDTLAKIYMKQGFYEKAIHAYEKLSLKYPEKNIYFAGQIKKIKEIINNQ